MKIVQCPFCRTPMVPRADGTCVSCGQALGIEGIHVSADDRPGTAEDGAVDRNEPNAVEAPVGITLEAMQKAEQGVKILVVMAIFVNITTALQIMGIWRTGFIPNWMNVCFGIALIVGAVMQTKRVNRLRAMRVGRLS